VSRVGIGTSAMLCLRLLRPRQIPENSSQLGVQSASAHDVDVDSPYQEQDDAIKSTTEFNYKKGQGTRGAVRARWPLKINKGSDMRSTFATAPPIPCSYWVLALLYFFCVSYFLCIFFLDFFYRVFWGIS
jgi:hypothetical protein